MKVKDIFKYYSNHILRFYDSETGEQIPMNINMIVVSRKRKYPNIVEVMVRNEL